MKKVYRIAVVALCAMLVLTSISYNALALRPMAHKVGGEQELEFQPQGEPGAKEAKGKAADRTKAIEETASLKKINELLWKWNFKIDVLSHKRVFLRSLGRKTGNVFKSLDAIIRNMEKEIPSLKGVVSEIAIERLKKAIEFLTRKREEKTKKKKIRYIRTPNEPVANRLITSVILEVRRLREPALKRRLEYELSMPGSFYRHGKWYVREQRYKYSKRWKTSVLSYRYIQYDTLWEAFRALDHQIDTELEERSWLFGCQRLLDKVRAAEIEDKAGLKEEIDSMLAKLKRVKVEDKRLARVILKGAKDLLDYERTKQAKGYLSIAKDLFNHRLEETEHIVNRLKEGRLSKLRQKADEKNRFLMEKAAKILRDLKTFHYGLTRKIIKEDFIEGKGNGYLKEPDFVAFIDGVEKLSKRLKGKRLEKEEIEAARRFFLLFHDRVVASIATDKFMEDYRDEYVKNSQDPLSVKKTHQEIFEEVFARYRTEDQNVKKFPELYYTIFYQAAFVAPKIGKPGERKDNPEFLKLADAIMITQAQKVGIRSEGIPILLHLKGAPEIATLLRPDYLFKRIDLAVDQAA